ncbi:IS3 family transposase [Gluconobacter sphaericus]|nr:IS3 family transposase [Gluconobacter sphaericus]
MKVELLWRQTWPIRQQATTTIFQYINGFYNPRRRFMSQQHQPVRFRS